MNQWRKNDENCDVANVGETHRTPKRTNSDQFHEIMKKSGVKSENNMRTDIKGLMDVREAREVCQDLLLMFYLRFSMKNLRQKKPIL